MARAADASTASASRALTRPETVSDALRIRVSAAATTLGYVPDNAARALARRRSGAIGIVAGDLERPGAASALVALDHCIAEAGWAPFFASDPTGVLSLHHARAMVARGVEALVFLGVDVPPELCTVQGIAGLPCVSVDRIDVTGFSANAGLDLVGAGKLASDYLVQLGHSSMAILAETDPSTAAIFDHLLRSRDGSSATTLWRVDAGNEPIDHSLLRWLELPTPPTAVICSSDAVALALMHACASRGIDIPRRVSIVGFGDTPIGRWTAPTLTSVRVPWLNAGLAAAEHVLACLTGRAPDQAVLPSKVVVRGSTGPPT